MLRFTSGLHLDFNINRIIACIIHSDLTRWSFQKDTFVLPLLWFGLAVKMSCSSPTSAQRAPTVSCYTNGMIVRLSKEVSENLKIKGNKQVHPKQQHRSGPHSGSSESTTLLLSGIFVCRLM